MRNTINRTAFLTIKFRISTPIPRTDAEWRKNKQEPVDIEQLCFALENEDNDFPLRTFDFKEMCWIGSKQIRLNSSDFITWPSATVNGAWLIKIFWQAGWDIKLFAWEPGPPPKPRPAVQSISMGNTSGAILLN